MDVDVVEDGKVHSWLQDFERGEKAGDKAPTGVSTIPAPAAHARPNTSAQLVWNCAVPFA
jgi:hypothetical protein